MKSASSLGAAIAPNVIWAHGHGCNTAATVHSSHRRHRDENHPIRFVVIASPRTASTSFCDGLTLKSDGRVHCLEHEPLGPGRHSHCLIPHAANTDCSPQKLLRAAFQDQGCGGGSLYASTSDGIFTLRYQPVACGFKVFGEHLRNEGTDLQRFFEHHTRPLVSSLRGVVDRVIILEGRNKTAQFKSWTKAMKTGQWGNIKSASTGPDGDMVTFDATLNRSVRVADT